jgi:hypothetical protein
MSAAGSPGQEAGDPSWLPPLAVPPPEDGDVDSDPVAGPPDGPDAWLAELSAADLAEYARSLPPPVPEAIGAGFTHREHRGGPGLGFAAGGPADLMDPGPVLAGCAARAREEGLAALSDDEVVGLLGAARRLASWAAALELAAVTDLDRRRVRAGSGGWKKFGATDRLRSGR